MADRQKWALSFIFITLLIDFTGFGIISPVVPKLIETLTGGDISDAAQYGGWLTFSYAIIQFVCAPILGGLSDRYGRRPVLLLSMFGMGVDYLFLAFAPSIFWLFVGRIILGFTGASITAASAYIADISTPEKRAQNFGLLGMALGIGFTLGPSIGGFASKLWGVHAPFLITAGMSLLNALYGYFILPESLKRENRRAFEWKRSNPVGTLKQLKNYQKIYSLLGAVFLIYTAVHAIQSNWTFYNMYKFNWEEDMVGLSLSLSGILLAIVQGGLIRIVLPKLGYHRAVYIGLLIYTTSFLLFGLATAGWMMFAILVLYSMGGVFGPSLQGIMSNQVSSSEQGELQGAMTSLISLSNIIGPLVMTGVFHFFTKKDTVFRFPGAPFFLASIMTSIAAVLAIRAFRKTTAVAETSAVKEESIREELLPQ
ncbi:TCR/Tet family MFS transporter [Chitinophaga niabensis]|uniref:MFS transporter, DHA1 family, tetracycline resistance protein n=1 Tax=Chitinophaga niabensis TaxID=536979 RepID=A0A1N6E9D2_9BACT|nr:TCR/Tet family MFS transporter [Chitinophaga niabensis]SIN79571.1 MFS transporter, DHA1 family, tetracycline resistance protein [Chitinophaga niabensis]